MSRRTHYNSFLFLDQNSNANHVKDEFLQTPHGDEVKKKKLVLEGPVGKSANQQMQLLKE